VPPFINRLRAICFVAWSQPVLARTMRRIRSAFMSRVRVRITQGF